MFFSFSSVSNQMYLLRKNRYQLTVFDRLNSYINKSNKLLIDIFEELKKYETEKINETEVENSLRTELNTTKSVNTKRANS